MTIKPLDWSAASRSASGTATACKVTPSHPRGRNDDDLAARPKGRHAEAAAGSVENGSALLTASKTKIQHDAPVNEAAAGAVPFGAGKIDEPQPCARAARSICTDREGNRAGLRLRRDDRWRRGARSLNPQPFLFAD
jgi:hypothetical protein